MHKEKLHILSSIYKNANSTKILITDENFNILWSNDNFFVDSIKTKCIKKYIENQHKNKITQNIIIPVTIENVNFTLDILPVFEEEIITGYLIRLVTLKELTEHQMNKDFAESQLDFFSSVRTQVSGIISVATFIHDTLERAELYEDLKYLNHQVNYCYRLLALTLNRSEIAKYSFGIHNIVKVNLNNLMNDIVFIVKTLLRTSDITITYNCTGDAFVNVDTDRFVVMILNLIINGVQYNISEKKEISLEIKSNEDIVSISVSDNGQGMTSEQIDEILSRFANSQNSVLFKSKIGYGYYIVNYFCKTFNSKIIINSKVNCGTTVIIKIPTSKNNDQTPLYLESKTAEYLSNRFSNMYIALSQITDIHFF